MNARNQPLRLLSPISYNFVEMEVGHGTSLATFVGLSFIRRTGVVLLLLLFASFVFLLLSQLLSCALLNLYFRICTLYLLEYDCTS